MGKKTTLTGNAMIRYVSLANGSFDFCCIWGCTSQKKS